jgi:paraquat-inducible protein B
MNDAPPPDQGPSEPRQSDRASVELPRAQVLRRRPFLLVWLIPVVALVIAAYLGIRAVRERGAEIVITFSTADGLTAGQTKVQHKAVDLGTVQRINLTPDLRRVELHVQMRSEANRMLTDQARFWVVRPRISAGNLTGLDTLISGSYIEIDPGGSGQTGGKPQTEFTGLEEPPAVRSDEPGRTFTLSSDRIGSLASGSPVFFHDIAVGEVLGYDLSKNGDKVTIHTFIRKPYDDFVHDDTRFWNISGINLKLGAQGIQVQVESLQALLSGGIAFDRPVAESPTPVAAPGATFPLFADEDSASAASYTQRLAFTTYVESSVRGLSVGAPVELYGIQIGNVTSVKLLFDPAYTSSRVRIDFEIQPERIMRSNQGNLPAIDVARGLVQRGLRAQLRSANLITGQLLLAMAFFPDAPAADVSQDGNSVVIPSMATSGIDSITNSLSALSNKLGTLPLDQIGKSLNDALGGVAKITNGPELQETLRSLQAAVSDIQDLVRKVDAGMTPALKRLPEIASGLQTTIDRASKLIASFDGGNSEFGRNLQRLLNQASDTARSIRLLADYLDQHPEALLRGRSDNGERSR